MLIAHALHRQLMGTHSERGRDFEVTCDLLGGANFQMPPVSQGAGSTWRFQITPTKA